MNLNRIAFLIASAGIAIRLVLIFGFQRYDLFRAEPVKIAISLAKTSRFADPYIIPTGFTAHAAPLYPILLSPLYYFFGDSRAADFARVILSVIVAAVGYALLPFVAKALDMSVSVGIVSGLTGALLPAHFWPESMGQFETAFVPLFMEISVILFARLVKTGSLSVMPSVWAGIWCGLGALLSPSTVPCLAGLAALAYRSLRGRIWRRTATLSFFVAALIMAPWLVRNYVRLGGLTFVRDNFGLELYLSNNDSPLVSEAEIEASSFFAREHPLRGTDTAHQLIEQGELSFEHERLRRALQWIQHNRRRFMLLTGKRIWNFWFYDILLPVPRAGFWLAKRYGLLRPTLRLLVGALNAAALAGMILLFQRNRWAAIVLASILLTYPVVYYLVQNGMRYQHGVYWITLLLAAQTGREIGKRMPQRPPLP